MERLPDRLESLLGVRAPDILVNAAGAFDLAPLAATTPACFDAHVDANLRGPFLAIRAFLAVMIARGSGHIATIGSVAGRRAFPMNGAYAATKYGVRGLHEVLDLELKGTGVRSTLIEPAATDTTLWDAVDRAIHTDLPPRTAMLDPDAVADAVLFALTRPAATAVHTIFLERA
jgi:NADP-dependent 3-hydroxy acid dehydrogenase YdfG